jgi:putative PIN family toxin of toxin-antitoxin system
MSRRLRVLADTNVLVSAVISREGVSATLVMMARQGQFELVISPKLLDELETVLARPRFRRYLSVEEVDRYVALVRETGDIVQDPPARSNV